MSAPRELRATSPAPAGDPGAAVDVGGPPSRHLTRNCSAGEAQRVTTLDAETVKRRGRRIRRYDLRSVLWDLSTQKRCRACGRVPASGAAGREGVTPQVKVADGVAHYAGVARCGSVWACPVCSPKIRQERAQEIDRGGTAWLSGGELHHEMKRRTLHHDAQDGRTLLFLTLTMPHDFGDDLAALMKAIKKAWRRIFSGRSSQAMRARFSVPYYVRNWDATHGRNGWHPHKHAVLFCERTLTPDELHELEAEIYARYRGAIEESGYRPPSRAYGIHLEEARSVEELSAYVGKIEGAESGIPVALELTRGDLKEGRRGHRTPIQVLESFAASGDVEELEIWHEWETGTKGQHFTQWSPGLKHLLGVNDRTDEEIVEEEEGGETVYTFQLEEWRAVCDTPAAAAKILDLAEEGGPAAVAPYVAEIYGRWKRRRRSRGGRHPP